MSWRVSDIKIRALLVCFTFVQVSRLERLVVLRLDANSLSSLPDELETLLDLTGI